MLEKCAARLRYSTEASYGSRNQTRQNGNPGLRQLQPCAMRYGIIRYAGARASGGTMHRPFARLLLSAFSLVLLGLTLSNTAPAGPATSILMVPVHALIVG